MKRFFLHCLLLIMLCAPIQSFAFFPAFSFTLQDLFDEYLHLDRSNDTFQSFQNKNQTQIELKQLHEAWETTRNSLIYMPPRIPFITGKQGVFYATGETYDHYQNHLIKSYELLSEIENELDSALQLACKICRTKQRVDLQTCPLQCPL